MTGARVLMQRGLRVNPECKKLWIEYFKLELLWVAVIKERRRVLLKGGGKVEAKKEGDEGEGDEEDRTVKLPQLDEESAAPQTSLESDSTVSASTKQGQSSDTAAMLNSSLTASQKALLEVLIPRAIYRNAIATHPTDLPFRISFLTLYKQFPDTQAGQEEVYESLRKDFGDEPKARGVLAERFLDGVGVDDPKLPGMLKKAVEEFEVGAKEVPSVGMWEVYVGFLRERLESVDEENLVC